MRELLAAWLALLVNLLIDTYQNRDDDITLRTLLTCLTPLSIRVVELCPKLSQNGVFSFN